MLSSCFRPFLATLKPSPSEAFLSPWEACLVLQRVKEEIPQSSLGTPHGPLLYSPDFFPFFYTTFHISLFITISRVVPFILPSDSYLPTGVIVALLPMQCSVFNINPYLQLHAQILLPSSSLSLETFGDKNTASRSLLLSLWASGVFSGGPWVTQTHSCSPFQSPLHNPPITIPSFKFLL